MSDRHRYRYFCPILKTMFEVAELYWSEDNRISVTRKPDGCGIENITEENLLQCAAYKDKNKKLMFDGDICSFYIKVSDLHDEAERRRHKSSFKIITMEKGCWGFKPVFPEMCHENDRDFRPFYDQDDDDFWKESYFEIIGNVFEDLEAMKEKE